MERYCLLSRNTSLQGHVYKAKAVTSQLSHQKFWDENSFQAQIIRHKEEHFFSVAQLCFKFYNQIEEAFVMADRVTEKFLWKNRNESRVMMITRSKCKLKEKSKRKFGEGTLGSVSALVAPPGALEIESSLKPVSGY